MPNSINVFILLLFVFLFFFVLLLKLKAVIFAVTRRKKNRLLNDTIERHKQSVQMSHTKAHEENKPTKRNSKKKHYFISNTAMFTNGINEQNFKLKKKALAHIHICYVKRKDLFGKGQRQ